jgi:hypothetical protein
MQAQDERIMVKRSSRQAHRRHQIANGMLHNITAMSTQRNTPEQIL